MIQLRSYQEPHFQGLLSILQRLRFALDASDTGTGKTVVALFLCKALGVVPLVIGPKTSRAGWEDLARLVGVEIEFVNYEKLRGRRRVRPEDQAAYDRALAAYDARIKPWRDAEDAMDYEAMARLGPRPVLPPDPPRPVADTDWLEEQPWGSGSFLKWKHPYEFIIFDEVHRCGGSTSLNSKALIAAKRQAHRVLALSATAADDPRQMKALGYLLDLHGNSKKTLPSRMTYMDWLLRHGCKPGVFGGFAFTADREQKRRAFTKLHGEVFPAHGARMRKAEIPGFPKTLIDIKLLTDETGKAKKLTEQLHKANQDQAKDTAMSCRQKLEVLKVPHLVDLTLDYAQSSKVAIFVNFTEPLEMLLAALRKEFGFDRVGNISGAQTGKQGEAERFRYLAQFQANRLDALVCNALAGGESANMHDPTGQVDRTALICPCESGRQFQQITGRVNRDSGAYSQQFVTYFRDTYEQDVADRLAQKGLNIELLNDADFIC